MSIASAISQAQQRVANAYTAISAKGGTLPATQNLANMPTAIGSIPSGGGSSVTALNYQIFYDSSVTSEEVVAPALSNKIFLVDSLYRCIDIENSTFLLPRQTSITGSSAINMDSTGKLQLKEAHFDALETITGGKIFQTTFQNCTNLITITFSNLTTASATSCFGQAFKNCTSLTTVSFDKLSTLSGSYAFGGTNAVGGAFNGCTSLTTLSFHALTSTSFGSYTNQFNAMLKGVTGCTIHFPSNLQTTISSLSSYPLFGGTNTTLAFDLPATS